MPGLGKMLIAAAAFAALGNQHTLSGHRQVSDRFAGLFVVSERADGNEQVHVRPGMTATIGAFAVPAAIGFEFAIVAVAQQRVVVGIRLQINAAAMAAVTAGWAAAGDELLASKRNAAIAAVAGLYQYFCFVNKHENHSPQRLAARRPPLKTIA
jgi:hypothetical protein